MWDAMMVQGQLPDMPWDGSDEQFDSAVNWAAGLSSGPAVVGDADRARLSDWRAGVPGSVESSDQAAAGWGLPEAWA